MRYLATFLLVFLAGSTACDKKGADGATDTSTSETSTEATDESEDAGELVVYCGRNEEMLKPLIEKFDEANEVDVRVQYAKSAELAATLVEEGENTPADIFFAQDVSTLGFLSKEGRLTKLDSGLLESVPKTFRAEDGTWVGTSGRARVLAYNTSEVAAKDLPADIDALIDDKWKGRLGWAPENASFQSFVAAMIAERGEDETRKWLEAIQKLDPKAYPSNTPMVTAIGRGEILVGLTNHYYLYRLKKEHGEDFPVANHYFKSGKAGSLVNSAGVGIVKSGDNPDAAEKFVAFMISDEAQEYFANQTHEFPLIEGIEAGDDLPPISELNPPKTDLSSLGQLEPAVKLLREVGALK